MKTKGFIVTSNYTLHDNKPHIHLYGRLIDGKSFHIEITGVAPYFFIAKEDAKRCEELTHVKPIPVNLKNLKHEPVARVDVNNPKEVPPLRTILQDNNIACYEADVLFTQRYLIDNRIIAMVEIDGKPEEDNWCDYRFINPKLQGIEEYDDGAQPTVLSFDIETDMYAKEVRSIALYTKEHNEVLVLENKYITSGKFKDTTVVPTEKELLALFVKRVRELDPDVITGWNVIDFDLQVLAKRCKSFDIPFTLGRDEATTTMRLESSFFRDSAVSTHGRIILDGIQLLKSSFIKLDDYKLNTAAKHFVGESKLIEEDERFELIDEMYTKDPHRFIEYNRKDAKLVYDILFASDVYDLTIQRTLLTGMHMDRVKASIASFDSLYLRDLRARGFVAPSTIPQEDEAGLGGYVLKSEPGIYTNVLVFDFKSLYPSLMRTFNIDPLSYLGTKESLGKELDKNKHIVAPNGAVFSKEEGILTHLLAKLWKARDKAKSQGNELARYAIKILMNSMYGVLASPNSRFHIRNLSNAITYFGQHFIKLTVKELEKKGFEVIYGDTDSVFVDIVTDDVIAAQQIGRDIQKYLNEFFTKYIKEEYGQDSVLELEYEKTYMRFFMPSVRGSEEGAKKRYAGKLVTAVKGTKERPIIETKLDFTGLEFVRRDWTQVSKTFQMQLLDLIFNDKEVDDFIRTFVKDLKEKKYDDQLVYRKALRKPLSAYTKTTPPHVKAAQQLERIDSKIISYVLTTDGPQPTEKQVSQIDYDHYIDKQIKPIAQSLLRLQDKDFDEVIKGSQQKGLSSFFG